MKAKHTVGVISLCSLALLLVSCSSPARFMYLPEYQNTPKDDAWNIVIANVDIAPGTVLTREMLSKAPIPYDKKPLYAQFVLRNSLGRTATRRILKNEILTINDARPKTHDHKVCVINVVRTLKAGQKLVGADVVEEWLDQNDVPNLCAQSIEQVDGSFALTNMKPGQFVYIDNITSDDQTAADLSELIRKHGRPYAAEIQLDKDGKAIKLVAKGNLKAGDFLSANNIREEHVEAKSMAKNCLSDINAVGARYLAHSMRDGEAVTEDDLADEHLSFHELDKLRHHMELE